MERKKVHLVISSLSSAEKYQLVKTSLTKTKIQLELYLQIGQVDLKLKKK